MRGFRGFALKASTWSLLAVLLFSSMAALGQASAHPEVETLASGLRHPVGVAVAQDGKVYFSEFGVEGCLCVYIPDRGVVEKLLTGLVSPSGVGVSPDGKVYVVESAKGRLWVYNPETGSSEIVKEGDQLLGVWNVAVGADGAVYLCVKGIPSEENPEGGKLLKLNPETGEVKVLASRLYVPHGLDVAPNGDLYFVEFGTPERVQGTLKVLRADTGRVETLLENLAWPYDVAVAGDGTVYFTVKAGKIYVFKGSGEPELLAEGFTRLYGVALDSENENLYFVEFGSPVVSGDRGDGSLRRIALRGVSEAGTLTVTRTETKTVTATVTRTVTAGLGGTVEELKDVVESLTGSLQTVSLMVWVTLTIAVIAVLAAVIALVLTLKTPKPSERRRKP